MSHESDDCLVCNWRCLLCGEPQVGHDDAACDEKMRNWQPRGFLTQPPEPPLVAEETGP